jgi:SMI1 / KNR4 family (SUKH-1)
VPVLDFSRIKDALVSLEALQPRVFGVDSHDFHANPTLSEADILTFEKEHRVSLPDDFRQFLTNVGNGGAGPFYGVFPLGEMDDNFGYRRWQEGDGMVGILSEPFPFQEEWNDLSTMPSEDLLDQDPSEYDRQMELFERAYWSASLVNGAFPICHEGCALRILLVVNGAVAGYLWEDRRSEDGGLKPLRLADGSLAMFAGWYCEWLECSLAATESRS